jgi:hypothetical protein
MTPSRIFSAHAICFGLPFAMGFIFPPLPGGICFRAPSGRAARYCGGASFTGRPQAGILSCCSCDKQQHLWRDIHGRYVLGGRKMGIETLYISVRVSCVVWGRHKPMRRIWSIYDNSFSFSFRPGPLAGLRAVLFFLI